MRLPSWRHFLRFIFFWRSEGEFPGRKIRNRAKSWINSDGLATHPSLDCGRRQKWYHCNKQHGSQEGQTIGRIPVQIAKHPAPSDPVRRSRVRGRSVSQSDDDFRCPWEGLARRRRTRGGRLRRQVVLDIPVALVVVVVVVVVAPVGGWWSRCSSQ